MAKVEEKKELADKTLRQIAFPSDVYLNMQYENMRDKKAGRKVNTEETIIELLQDGIKFRKLQRAGKIE